MAPVILLIVGVVGLGAFTRRGSAAPRSRTIVIRVASTTIPAAAPMAACVETPSISAPPTAEPMATPAVMPVVIQV